MTAPWRVCKGTSTKTAGPCTRPARYGSDYCGHCDPEVRARRSSVQARVHADRRQAADLRRGNEVAAELIAAHRLSWCRARLLHALAGAMEQGILGGVLEELMEKVPDHARRHAEVEIRRVLRRWQPVDARLSAQKGNPE